MKNNKILVLYLDKDEGYFAKSFEYYEMLKVEEFIDEINNSKDKKLLWLVSGKLLNIIPGGEIYGW